MEEQKINRFSTKVIRSFFLSKETPRLLNSVKKNRIALNQQREFYYMMQFYLNSRLPIIDAINLTMEDTGILELEKLIHKVSNGEIFYKALKDIHLTDPFIDSCLMIGESRGSYPDAFAAIIEYLDQKISDRKYIAQISAYPAILLLLILGVMCFVIFVVAPQLHKTLSSLNFNIPKSLQVLNAIHSAIIQGKNYILILLITVICVGVSGIANEKLAAFVRKIFFNRKIVKSLYQGYAMRRIFWQIEVLFSSGIDIVRAIRIVASSYSFMGYNKILFTITDGIEKGRSFGDMLQEHQEFFLSAVIVYVKLGEKTDTLAENLKNVVALMEIKTKDTSDNLKKVMQPAMIIIAALMISALLAIVLPILNAATGFGGI